MNPAPDQSPAPGAEPLPWGARYAAGDTPWDLGRAHQELLRRVAAGELPAPPGPALVPGCGRGHDALGLSAAGFAVTALDLVEELAGDLGPTLEAGGGRFVAGDALEFEGGPFALVFEHTFFCALPPERRPDWGRLMARVTRPGSIVAALVFPADKPLSDGGPPHRTGVEDLARALGAGFELERNEPVQQPVERRQWLERWAVFRAS